MSSYNFEESRKTEILAHRRKYFHEMNEINFKRWSGRLTNLTSFGETKFLKFMIKEDFNGFLPNGSFVSKFMI